MVKPFKGVISNWVLADNRIIGTCVFHTTEENGIANGGGITTSAVVTISSPENSYKILETKNSRYILV